MPEAAQAVEADDVKQTEDSSNQNAIETELDEKDLEAAQTDKKIPYSRFKEVNDAKKTLEQQLAEKEAEWQKKLERELDLERIRLQGQQTKAKDDDYDLVFEDEQVSKEVAELKQQIAELKEANQNVTSRLDNDRWNTKLTRLQAKYPNADVDAVLGWAKSMGKGYDDLEDLMAHSDQKMEAAVQKRLQQIVENKKKARESAIPSGNRIQLKPEERPKSVKEASRAARKFLNS